LSGRQPSFKRRIESIADANEARENDIDFADFDSLNIPNTWIREFCKMLLEDVFRGPFPTNVVFELVNPRGKRLAV
jgi:hypothetical protein